MQATLLGFTIDLAKAKSSSFTLSISKTNLLFLNTESQIGANCHHGNCK